MVLRLLAEAPAFLTLGSIRLWGLMAPRWAPLLGRRRVRPSVVIAPALPSSALLASVGTAAPFGGWARDPAEPDPPHRFAGVVKTLAHLPLVPWGPLLGTVAIDCARRTLRWRRPRGQREAPIDRQAVWGSGFGVVDGWVRCL